MENRERQQGRALQHDAAQTQPSAQQLLERYGDQLEDENLSEEQAKEFLNAIWHIMVAFVDIGFSVRAGEKLSKNSDIGFDDVLHYLIPEATAPETVASSENPKKKEPR
ncbi:hypothetical protein SAMN05421538_11432 [Paracoccus isoporae]|uniref:Uncharacterized protein n=1 Tax=Paracoccus isoporae TaxID=591205 RepID=A0A1G7GPP9_9RHOB|nr:hypothetical protein [Paracoccus isoporae]SDE90094.1 hypothetical protein SAMN05421538_11432 [Paracoccus isoporae]